MFMLCIVLAMCSWVDVDPSEEPQYQYPEQPSSEQFEQQEQFEEGKYLCIYCTPIRTFLATLYPLYIVYNLVIEFSY